MKNVKAGSGARETATMMIDVETVMIELEIPTLQVHCTTAYRFGGRRMKGF